MTTQLFLSDAYLRETDGQVQALTETGGVVLDQSLFYATGGGQPGDCGHLVWDGGEMPVATTVKGENGQIILVPADGATSPVAGTVVRQHLDWDRRYRHMRIHTALHLLSVVIPLPVTGGAITADKGRLDFDMPEAPEDKAALEAELNDLIARDYAISESWITDDEPAANPGWLRQCRSNRLWVRDASG